MGRCCSVVEVHGDFLFFFVISLLFYYSLVSYFGWFACFVLGVIVSEEGHHGRRDLELSR